MPAVRTLTVRPPSGPLPAPVLEFPANGATVTAGQQVSFFWQPVNGAASYELQVANSAAFTPPLVLRRKVKSNQVNTSKLPVGSLFWRVRAMDLGGSRGLVGHLPADRHLRRRMTRRPGLSPRGRGAGRGVQAGLRAMNTNSSPGRSGASLTSSTTKPAEAREPASSSWPRNRSVESEVSTAPPLPNTKVARKDTRPGPALVRSYHVSTGPTPGMTTRR